MRGGGQKLLVILSYVKNVSALECPTLSPPLDGYLVYRNISAAEYMCCVGYVFPDTLERSRTLYCLQNAWDRNLPSECISMYITNHAKFRFT